MRYVLAGMAGALLAVFLLGAAPATQGTIKCRSLEIVDSHGRARVMLDVTDREGGTICLIGGEGKESGAIMMLAEKDGSSISADVIFAKAVVQ